MRTPLHSLASMLRQARSSRDGTDTTVASDGELLRRFQTRGDETAFELLVWRHGPMVLGVCRRVLGEHHAAEDAFQATFLTLARKAGTIGVRDAIAGWLYTVARRVALAARARQARYLTHELSADGVDVAEPGYLPPDELSDREERELLREEVDRLPMAFRAVIILCCLEGRTRAQAAEQLGVPIGTVESRLARAQDRLRRSLLARGLALAVAPFAVFLADHMGDLVKVSPALVYGTVHLAMVFKIGALALANTAAELVEEAERTSLGAFKATVSAAVVSVGALVLGACIIFPGPARAMLFGVEPPAIEEFQDTPLATSAPVGSNGPPAGPPLNWPTVLPPMTAPISCHPPSK
jgi:RNA polymerase sigma factor (sigma-70 family)